MMKSLLRKFNSNKGSTLVTAIVILVVITIVSTSLMFILMSNTSKSVSDYNKKVETLTIENLIYSEIKNKTNFPDSDNSTVTFKACEDKTRSSYTYSYSMTITKNDGKYEIVCTSTNSTNNNIVTVTCVVDSSYQVLSWSK